MRKIINLRKPRMSVIIWAGWRYKPWQRGANDNDIGISFEFTHIYKYDAVTWPKTRLMVRLLIWVCGIEVVHRWRQEKRLNEN